MVALNLFSLNPLDSFAAGIGAGSQFGLVHLDDCHRYDRGYPSVLQAFINDHSIKDENLKACAGHKAKQVKARAEFLDETVDLAMHSSSTRAQKMAQTSATVCLGNYWQQSPENGSGNKMAKGVRRQLNELVVAVNNKIDEVVRNFNDAKIQFINYDDSFNTHRFCEDRFTEPQRHSEERLDLFMHQYYTPGGQLQDDGEYLEVNVSAEAKDLAEGMLEFVNGHPDAQVATPFDEHPVDISRLQVYIPSGIMKVFHPTQKDHEQIAIEVWNAYTRESAPQPSGGLQPLPDGFPIGDSGTRVSGNFPRSFVLLDSNQPVRDILYRMRD
ncbi:hypothetical protein QQX98_013027 [Neonectria punicea]|uniref:Uncharacterized protein n=1 Tax=Neonectria punicea TaxID=979145 RepID=A0ABR1GHJ6_9HYPO